MNCQTAREAFPELLDARTAASTHLEARAHLANCPDCQREFAALSQTLAALDRIPTPQPSPRLRQSFYAMLEEEKHSAASVALLAERERRQHRIAVWRWILIPVGACALLAAGFLGGTRLAEPSITPQMVAENAATKRELQDLRSKVDRMEAVNQVFTAAFQQEREPATERLRGILTSAAQKNPNERVITELITSLALDPSPNVRLRALEALYPHADRDEVRAGVLASLPRETNALVQVAMIDFLAAARDRDAKPALERMSVNELVDTNVRQAAKRALAQL